MWSPDVWGLNRRCSWSASTSRSSSTPVVNSIVHSENIATVSVGAGSRWPKQDVPAPKVASINLDMLSKTYLAGYVLSSYSLGIIAGKCHRYNIGTTQLGLSPPFLSPMGSEGSVGPERLDSSTTLDFLWSLCCSTAVVLYSGKISTKCTKWILFNRTILYALWCTPVVYFCVFLYCSNKAIMLLDC